MKGLSKLKDSFLVAKRKTPTSNGQYTKRIQIVNNDIDTAREEGKRFILWDDAEEVGDDEACNAEVHDGERAGDVVMDPVA